LHVGSGALGERELRLGGARLGSDPRLLLVEQIYGDRGLIVGVQELCALVCELGEAALLAGSPGRLVGCARISSRWPRPERLKKLDAAESRRGA
jgi:hypothetical protein